MSGPGVYLDRMRANAALALAEGASVAIVEAHLLSVLRHAGMPNGADHFDGIEVAELVDALNEMRRTQPGEVKP